MLMNAISSPQLWLCLFNLFRGNGIAPFKTILSVSIQIDAGTASRYVPICRSSRTMLRRHSTWWKSWLLILTQRAHQRHLNRVWFPWTSWSVARQVRSRLRIHHSLSSIMAGAQSSRLWQSQVDLQQKLMQETALRVLGLMQGIQFVTTKLGGLFVSVEKGQSFTIQRLGMDDGGLPTWSGPCFGNISNVGLGLTAGKLTFSVFSGSIQGILQNSNLQENLKNSGFEKKWQCM